ncbi:MAG: M16 family metallopeptidase [Lacipirellulaceae bacterium]
MQFRSATLDNGLQVIAEVNPAALSLAVGFFVETGSRDESDDVAGVSHFLEHMAFKGTARRSAEDVNREFDELGAHYNAFTSEENTVYYASLLPEHQGEAVDLLGDILRPSLRADDFATEQKVILEEIEMYLDQPPYGMDDRVKHVAFGAHPIARSVLGTAESVGGLTPESMRDYFERRYTPSNVLLAASGAVDFDALVEQVSAACGHWTPREAPRALPPLVGKAQRETVTREAATQQYALILCPGPGGAAEERYAAKLLATILGDDTGSRLYWRLVDPGIAESASLGHYDYQGAGMFYAWLACEPDDIDDNLAAVLDELGGARKAPITERELAQAKSKIKSRVVLSSEKPRSRLFSVGGGWLMRRDYRTVRDELARLDAVTADDVARVAEAFPLDNPAIVTVGPRESVDFGTN